MLGFCGGVGALAETRCVVGRLSAQAEACGVRGWRWSCTGASAKGRSVGCTLRRGSAYDS